jgi:hypothetical protein
LLPGHVHLHPRWPHPSQAWCSDRQSLTLPTRMGGSLEYSRCTCSGSRAMRRRLVAIENNRPSMRRAFVYESW